MELHQRVPEHDLAALTRNLRQGDWVNVSRLPLVKDGEFEPFAAQHGAIIVSQTCDVLRVDLPHVLVAPLDRLEADIADEVRGGKRPRYVAVPQLGADAFVDLSVVASIDKTDLALQKNQRGVATDEEVRLFGRAVGRRFSRFPFPDEVVPWFQPLQKLVRSKSAKPSTAEGTLFPNVAELRVEATEGWTSPPFDLTLVVLLEPGTLPSIDDAEAIALPEGFDQVIRGKKGQSLTAGEIAALLVKETRPRWRYHLWMRLAEAWALRCVPEESYLQKRSFPEAQAIRNAVRGRVGVDVMATDEYTYARARRSEELDLDHLSMPLPQ